MSPLTRLNGIWHFYFRGVALLQPRNHQDCAATRLSATRLTTTVRNCEARSNPVFKL
jgi:hypothetical protein